MGTEVTNRLDDRITPEAVRAQLAKIVRSAAFSKGNKSADFLKFVVEAKLSGKSHEISMKSLRDQFYAKPKGPEEAKNTRVRNAAQRVRKALASYYDGEGLHDNIRISIPVGRYEPSFEWRAKHNLTVLPGARKPLPTDAADVPQSRRAFELYCEGRRYWGERRPDKVARAVGCFEGAICEELTTAQRPFAAAHAALADCYTFFYLLGRPHAECYSKALGAASAAVLYGPDSANAHSAVGAVTAIFHLNWEEAEQHFRGALDLNPDCLNAHGWFSGHLACLGRTDEAIYHARRAMAVDPLSICTSAHAAKILYFCRQYDAAIELLASLEELAPDSILIQNLLGMAYAATSQLEQAASAFERANRLAPSNPLTTGPLGDVYARLNWGGEARRILAELEEAAQRDYIPKSQIAQICVGLGEMDLAISLLERAFEERDFFLAMLGGWEPFDPLRSDPRFQAMLTRLNLTPVADTQSIARNVSLR